MMKKARMPSNEAALFNEPPAPVLVIAPHLNYPTRDGADILVNRLMGELSKFVSDVDIVTEHSIVVYKKGQIVKEISYANSSRPKWYAALRTIVLFSVYTRERFLTKSFLEASRPYLANTRYQAIVYSYLATAPAGALVPHQNVKQYVLTHNDDTAIYRNMRHSTANVMRKLTAAVSERWVRNFGRAIKDRLTFIHVSDKDAHGWTAAIGKHNYFVSKVGCDLPELISAEKPHMNLRPTRIVFVGSLGVKMNLDAIRHFAENFLPTIIKRIGNVEVRIVGSNPTTDMQKICQKYGFGLFANVSDRELSDHFAWADFSMLPFPYSTGTKLKLLDSISRGIPTLATCPIGHFDGIDRHTACLVSDDPSEWAEHINEWKATDISANVRVKLIEAARACTWEAMARQFFQAELAA